MQALKFIYSIRRTRMSELKIILKQPSIQDIQLKPEPNTSLSQSDIKRLFKGSSLPKFDLVDVKLQHIFCKRDKAQYFMQVIQQWNRRMEENQLLPINARTEFSMMEFIYSSIKRISMMTDHQIDKQLALLYNWFVAQTKNNSNFCRASMPRKKCDNQYYNVTKTFNTNPTIIIKQYVRPKCVLAEPNSQNIATMPQESEILGHQLKLKSYKSSVNNFVSNFGQKKEKEANFFQTQQKQTSQYKCLLMEHSSNRIRNEELRKYYESKQMEQQAWNFKLKRGRLESQNAKNYLNEKQNTIPRIVKTSEGNRNNLRKQIFESVKKMRVQTSLGKRASAQTKNNVKNVMITEVSSFGLLSNPFEVKLKLKKKKGKGKK